MLGDGNSVESMEDVQLFLDDICHIINDAGFNPALDINVSPKSKRQDETDPHTNRNTLDRLGYDHNDIASEILSLTPSNYEKTCIDKNPRLPNSCCFYKKIAEEDIIIKFRKQTHSSRKLFVLSFHSAERPVDLDNDYPYWGKT